MGHYRDRELYCTGNIFPVILASQARHISATVAIPDLVLGHYIENVEMSNWSAETGQGNALVFGKIYCFYAFRKSNKATLDKFHEFGSRSIGDMVDIIYVIKPLLFWKNYLLYSINREYYISNTP